MVSGIHGMSPSNFGAQGGAAQAFQDITGAADYAVDNPSAAQGASLEAIMGDVMKSYPNDPSIQSFQPVYQLLGKVINFSGAPGGRSLPIAMVASSIGHMTYNPNMSMGGVAQVQLTNINETIGKITAASPLNRSLIPQLIEQMGSIVQEYPNNAQAQSLDPILRCLTDANNEPSTDPRGSDQMISAILSAIPDTEL